MKPQTITLLVAGLIAAQIVAWDLFAYRHWHTHATFSGVFRSLAATWPSLWAILIGAMIVLLVHLRYDP